MLALPCCRCCGSVDRGGEGAEGASATGSEEPPPAASAAAREGRARSMSATDLVAFGWGRLRPLGGDRRRGTARLLRAAEMRPKTSGSDAGSPAAGGGGGGAAHVGRGGRESPATRAAPLQGRENQRRPRAAARGCPPRPLVGGERVSAPPTQACWPSCARCKSLGWGISRCCRAGHEGHTDPSAGPRCPRVPPRVAPGRQVLVPEDRRVGAAALSS